MASSFASQRLCLAWVERAALHEGLHVLAEVLRHQLLRKGEGAAGGCLRRLCAGDAGGELGWAARGTQGGRLEGGHVDAPLEQERMEMGTRLQGDVALDRVVRGGPQQLVRVNCRDGPAFDSCGDELAVGLLWACSGEETISWCWGSPRRSGHSRA